jgi:hypothetical protein
MIAWPASMPEVIAADRPPPAGPAGSGGERGAREAVHSFLGKFSV